MTTATDQPWYLEPEALAIIAGITERPEVSSSRNILGRSDKRSVYVGPALARLQRYWTIRFKQIDAIRPWPEALMRAVLMCASEQDVLAALFGNPGWGWAVETEQDRKWKRIRREIEDALQALKVAA